MSGICPPSKPGRVCPPERAVCPLPPRPAVLPIPEPGPRPLRMRARCDPAGARRPCSRRRSTVTGLAVALAFRRAGAFALVRARPLPVVFGFRFVGAIRLLAFLHRRHLDEVAHLIEHAAERGVILLHHGILVMLEPERLERPPLERRAADTGVDLLDAQRVPARGRQLPVRAPLALAVFPGGGQSSHGSPPDRKSTRLNSSHSQISYAVFCLKKKKTAT